MEINHQGGAKRKRKRDDEEFGPEESAPATKKQVQSTKRAPKNKNQLGVKKGGLSRQVSKAANKSTGTRRRSHKQ